MKFFDSSAIVPLLVHESNSALIRKKISKEEIIWSWWGTVLECKSAIHRRYREKLLTENERVKVLQKLTLLADSWHEITPSHLLRETAARLLATHQLRTADALQLAAALVACEGTPSRAEFLTFDEGLASAALLEGFVVPFGVERLD